MHIVFLILKIIGAILGGLLGLVLVLLLLILLVPVRYRATIKVQESTDVDSCFSWLFHIVHVKIRYTGKKVDFKLRIFGISMKKNKEEKSNRAKKKRQKKKEKKAEKVSKPQNEVKKLEQVEERTKSQKAKEDSVKELVTEPMHSPAVEEVKVRAEAKGSEELPEAGEKLQKVNTDNGKRARFHPIRKLKECISRIREFIDNLSFKLVKIKSAIKDLWDKKNKVVAFLKDEGTKNVWKKTKKILFGWLRYIAPRTLKGYIRFGTGDPCQTGQILGVISIFYAKYHPKFSVYPDFETKTLKADLYARGRMSFIRFVRDGAGWYFDKEVKKCIADIKQLKEEL